MRCSDCPHNPDRPGAPRRLCCLDIARAKLREEELAALRNRGRERGQHALSPKSNRGMRRRDAAVFRPNGRGR